MSFLAPARAILEHVFKRMVPLMRKARYAKNTVKHIVFRIGAHKNTVKHDVSGTGGLENTVKHVVFRIGAHKNNVKH